MRISRFFCSMIFVFCIFISFCFAECNHNFIIESDTNGNHYRKCSICEYKDNSSMHSPKSTWSFDDDGKYHFKTCVVENCSYEYEKGEHTGGNHSNDGMCSVCYGIYQTHELDAENIKFDNSYHWYICSYKDCKEVYDEEVHKKSSYIGNDLKSHWFRCELLDCNYKFNEESHYGGENNNGVCIYELCEKLYKARLEIDKYEFREYKVGDKDKLVAKIIPEGIKVPEAKYEWKSSKPSVVTVDKNGNIEAKHNGIATIYATYGELYASCVVVVGNLEFDITPKNHKVYVNEIATSSIDVTYKENKKTINVNDYVDFSVFKWTKDSLKADIRTVTENKANFVGVNVTDVPVTFYMWLDNRVRIIDESINKIFGEDEKINKNKFIKLEENLTEVLKSITENSNKKAVVIKSDLEELFSKISNSKEYTEEELNEFFGDIVKIKEKISDFNCRIIVEVMLEDVNIPIISPTSSIENYPSINPVISIKPVQSPGVNGNNPANSSDPNSGNVDNPEKSPGKNPVPSTVQTTSPKVTPTIEGPGHEPKPPSNSGSSNVINRKHTCSTLSYLPNPENPEKGHMKRCYSSECEFYKKGIVGTEQTHDYKTFKDKDKDVTRCIICWYEKGSGALEPKIVHSRDFGIDIMQSQYIIVKDEITEVDMNITGVEDDVAINYGPKDGNLKVTEGRNDENSVYLRWDIKEKYAKEALKVEFKKENDKRIMTLELKDGYTQPVTSEIDLILENKFGEKRIETIEVIKEAPERAQFILRFSSDVVSSIKVGETKDISVICKSMYGYGSSDRKEVQDYYKSKNLVHYEDIKLEWKGSGGINVTGESTPNEEGYAKGTITGVSSTQNGEKAEIIVIATAKYENEDLIDEVEREVKRGINVYVPSNSGTSNYSSSTANSSSSNLTTNPPQSGGSTSGSTLPVAAGVVGLGAIALVVIIVNKSTKG